MTRDQVRFAVQVIAAAQADLGMPSKAVFLGVLPRDRFEAAFDACDTAKRQITLHRNEGAIGAIEGCDGTMDGIYVWAQLERRAATAAEIAADSERRAATAEAA